uniref:Uncharacterized protein n=1 Tax=Anguilla anguilla TaxID=7936 RepID=A0A0E9TQS3_ANGAN
MQRSPLLLEHPYELSLGAPFKVTVPNLNVLSPADFYANDTH